MNVWFVRSNGNTKHNDPSTPNYVPGEPPAFPATFHNYHDKCLREGFVRLGAPNTGDLRDIGRGRLAPDGYTFASTDEHFRRYLMQYATIRTGDLMLLPAYTQQYDVHIGVVVLRDVHTREVLCLRPGLPAYYYYHAIPNREWYECAHRVDVLWDRDAEGTPGIHYVPSAPWRPAFAAVETARDAVVQIARSVGLPVPDA